MANERIEDLYDFLLSVEDGRRNVAELDNPGSQFFTLFGITQEEWDGTDGYLSYPLSFRTISIQNNIFRPSELHEHRIMLLRDRFGQNLGLDPVTSTRYVTRGTGSHQRQEAVVETMWRVDSLTGFAGTGVRWFKNFPINAEFVYEDMKSELAKYRQVAGSENTEGSQLSLEEWVRYGGDEGNWPGDNIPALPNYTTTAQIGRDFKKLIPREGWSGSGWSALSELHDADVGQAILSLHYGGADAAGLILQNFGIVADSGDMLNRMGRADAGSWVGKYNSNLNELGMVENMWDTLTGSFNAQFPEGTTISDAQAQELARAQRYLVDRLWGGRPPSGGYDLTEDMQELVDDMLGSPAHTDWLRLIALDPELQDAVHRPNNTLLSQEEAEAVWNEVFASTELADVDLEALNADPSLLNEAMLLYSDLAAGNITEAEFTFRELLLRGETGEADRVLDIFRGAATTPESIPIQYDSLSFQGQLRSNLTTILTQGLTDPEQIDTTQLDALIAEFDSNPILTSLALENPAQLEVSIVEQQLYESLSPDAAKAVFLTISEGKTTVGFNRFRDVTIQNFRARLGASGPVSDLDLNVVLSNMNSLWDYFQNTSLAAGGDLDPGDWWLQEFGDLTAAFAEDPEAASEALGTSRGFAGLFAGPEEVEGVDPLLTSYENALLRYLSPQGRLLHNLGVPLTSPSGTNIEDDASFIFAAQDSDTANTYFQRVGELLKARFNINKGENPDLQDIYGFGSTIDPAVVVENLPQDFVPGVVRFAESAGRTVGEIRAIQRKYDAGSRTAVSPTSRTTQSLTRPEVQDYLEQIRPIIQQLPVSQQNDAVLNAIELEVELRQQFLDQLPTDEQGNPIEDPAELDRLVTEADEEFRRQTAERDEQVINAVAREFGITPSQANIAVSRNEAEANNRQFADGGPVGFDIPTDATNPDPANLVGQQAGVNPNTTFTEDIYGSIRSRFNQVDTATAQPTQQSFGFARNFGAFLRRQPLDRFNQPQTEESIIRRRLPRLGSS